MPGGAEYIIIYLKLQLLVVETDGIYIYQNLCDDIESEIAEIINENLEATRYLISYLQQIKWLTLIEEKENDGVYFLKINNLDVGSETESASRKRIQRAKQKLEQIETNKTLAALTIKDSDLAAQINRTTLAIAQMKHDEANYEQR